MAQQVQLRSLLARAHGGNIGLSAVNEALDMYMRTWRIGRVPVPQQGRVETAQTMQFNPQPTILYETHTH
ncbi:hypothetical protein PHISP_02130 [Aspergillus sp. HF37]|nr:hypothetical protein PHISP_02130 [Aspergillus sp. HF37]